MAFRRGALAGGAVIIAELKEGGLLSLRHGLGAAQSNQVASLVAAAVDLDGTGQRHGGSPGEGKGGRKGAAYTAARLSSWASASSAWWP